MVEDLGGGGLLRCVCVGRDEFIVFSDGFVWVRMGLLFWICVG